MNRLTNERSPYLQHAAGQRIDWYPWSEEAFEKARHENKPVFLSTGAVWCHWCHVMARESFEDAGVAALLNELFISIKLDRDERPDIDRRYQQAVAAMGGGSGWPLSVFLTPEKKPFFGGTYFPPEDRQGRPGFGKVLRSVHDFYQARRADADEYAGRIMEALRPDAPEPGTLRFGAIPDAVASVLSSYDPQNGGFGHAPKFPMPGAIEFLLHNAARTTEGHFVELAVRKTLTAMARGGFHDQLQGGFHRYSVDESWIVPHFEKMADDNALLLRNYVDAYALFGDEHYRSVARGIITFVHEVLSDPAGGFYSSQDADVTPEDEGGYFTWTEAELRSALSEEEYRILSRHWFHEQGIMHHDRNKRVLALAREPREIAQDLSMSREDVERVIESGNSKLLRQRNMRTPPFIDKTLYTSLNGMFITSFLRAFRSLHDPWLRDFALKSLDRVLRERLKNGILYHTDAVVAVLDDYVFLAEALVAAYETSGEKGYLVRAEEIMTACMQKFQDEEGGFFDTEQDVLGTRLKHIEDTPHQSPNAVASLLLIRLAAITGNASYRAAAEKTLQFFVGSAGEMGVHAGSYFAALQAFTSLLTLTVEAEPSGDLATAARAITSPYTAILYGEDNGRVLPCAGNVCYQVVHSVDELKDVMEQIIGEPHHA